MDSIILKKNQFNFWRWVLNLKAIKGRFFRQLHRATFCGPGRNFCEIGFFFRKVSSKSFLELERNTVGLSGRIVNMLVEIALYISRGSSWWECINFKVWYTFFFADFEQRKCGPFANFRRWRENCILRARRISLKKYVILSGERSLF